jgi:hypothetical protein
MGGSAANRYRPHQKIRDAVYICGGLEIQALHTKYKNTYMQMTTLEYKLKAPPPKTEAAAKFLAGSVLALTGSRCKWEESGDCKVKQNFWTVLKGWKTRSTVC